MTYTYSEYGRAALNTSYSLGPRIARGEIDAVFHGGDISYATGYLAVWDFFMDMMAPVTSGVIYMTIVGNHEIDYPTDGTFFTGTDSGGECGVPTLSYFPEVEPATVKEPWWSYDVGLVHFVGMSSEHNFTIGSKQYLWLEHDLASVDRSITPWIAFGTHRAMYINSDYGGPPSSDQGTMALLIENIEPLLWKYKVNIGFYGHNHAVQRHSAVLNSEVIQASTSCETESGELVHYHENPQATVHFVIGTGGADFTVNYVTPNPVWNEEVFYKYGYTIMTAVNSSYLTWDWIESATDEVVYRTVITQDSTKLTSSDSWDLNLKSPSVCPNFPSISSSSSSPNAPPVYVIVILSIFFSLVICFTLFALRHRISSGGSRLSHVMKSVGFNRSSRPQAPASMLADNEFEYDPLP